MTHFPIILLLIPVLSTLAGGLFALRFRKTISLLVALSAGLLLGAAFLDLLPEALAQSQTGRITTAGVLSMTLFSFLIFFAIEMILGHVARHSNAETHSRAVGRIGGAMLIFHSFRDGMAIGASCAASPATGYAVAMGIAAHDLGDGMNTVLLTTGGDRPGPVEIAFLAADCIAPFAGGLFAFHWLGSARDSVLLLAVAAGFFLQMASSDFLPHIRECNHPRYQVLGAVFLGTSIIYAANWLVTMPH